VNHPPFVSVGRVNPLCSRIGLPREALIDHTAIVIHYSHDLHDHVSRKHGMAAIKALMQTRFAIAA
jgi:hypothetical protein